MFLSKKNHLFLLQQLARDLQERERERCERERQRYMYERERQRRKEKEMMRMDGPEIDRQKELEMRDAVSSIIVLLMVL